MSVFRGILMTWPGRIFAIALIGLMAGGAVFVSRANAPAAKTELRTQAVTKGSVIQSVAVSGSVAASNQTKMSFKTAGKIAALYVSVGQQVTAGQPLEVGRGKLVAQIAKVADDEVIQPDREDRVPPSD